MDRRTSDKWHLSKGIDVGHVLTTVAIIIGLTSSWIITQNQIAVNTANIQHNKELIMMQKELVKDMGVDVNERLIRMDAKLDRLVEKEHNGTK